MKRPRGRPALPSEDQRKTHALRISPQVWAEVEALVPKGKRSVFIDEAIKRELARRRQAAAAGSQAEGREETARAEKPLGGAAVRTPAAEPEKLTPEEQIRRVHAAFGSMAHVSLSVEDVLARKREEAALEEEIWERRRRGGAS